MSKPNSSKGATRKIKLNLKKETIRDLKPINENGEKIKGGQGSAALSRRPC